MPSTNFPPVMLATMSAFITYGYFSPFGSLLETSLMAARNSCPIMFSSEFAVVVANAFAAIRRSCTSSPFLGPAFT